jgi:deoxyribonuclease-2
MNFFVFMALLTLSLAESCLDLNGQEVSWWVAIKIPTSVAVKSSTYFLYSDANVAKHSSSFQEFNFTIDRHNSPLTLTLDQINKNHDLNVLAWNDEKPGPRGATSSGAHAKAVFVANSAMKKGFYVGHSMPRYPDFKGKSVNTSIPDSANIYG